MKECDFCHRRNPEEARYCMECGRRLPEPPAAEKPRWKFNLGGGGRPFLLTLGGSLLLSFVLIAVFKLPIFILAAFLPLLWTRKR